MDERFDHFLFYNLGIFDDKIPFENVLKPSQWRFLFIYDFWIMKYA